MLGAEYFLVQLLYLLFPFSTLAVVFLSSEVHQYKSFFLYFSLIILVFISTYFKPISYSGDELTYLDFYDFVVLNGYLPEYLERTEFGFSSLLEFFANTLGFEGRLFYSLISTFGFVLVLSAFKSVSISLTSVFVFFVVCTNIIFWGMQSPRQYIAICLFSYSLRYVGTKCEYKHFVFILVAMMFHKSALMVCLVSLFYRMKLSNVSVYITCLFVLFLSFYGVSGILEDFVSSLSFLHSGRYDEVEFVLASEKAGFGYIISIFAFLLTIYLYGTIKNKPRFTVFLFNIYFISSLVKFLFVGVDYVNRFYMYFVFSNAFFLAVVCVELLRARRFLPFGIVVALTFLLYMASSIQKVDTFF